MKLKCINCGYTKEIVESELMENSECILCGGSMIFEQSANYLEEQKKDEENLYNETEGINEVIDNQLIANMTKELEHFGKERLWEVINKCDIDLRLQLIPIYIEAVRLKESED